MLLTPVPPAREGVFLKRLNRFAALVRLSTGVTTAHVPDPGRLRELLFPGNRILVLPPGKPGGKTSCSILAAEKKNCWILTNTTFHSRIAEALAESGIPGFGSRIHRAEVTLPGYSSRFDFLLEDRTILEVKGCTLEENGTGLFPDAPTSRGARQVREMTGYIRNGGRGILLFIATVPWTENLCTDPRTDPGFSDAVDEALNAGARVAAAVVSLGLDGIHFSGMIPFKGRFDYRTPIHNTEGIHAEGQNHRSEEGDSQGSQKRE